MQLADKVRTTPFFCGIDIGFTTSAVPSITVNWQPFYNSTFINNDFESVYASIGSIDFQEESNDTAAGTSYDQKLIFRFPVTDENRSERIALFHKLKYVKLKLSNGLFMVMGRNDYNQNALPKIKSKTNSRICEITIETKSMFPVGYMN